MATFVIQKDYVDLDVESMLLKNEISKSRYIHNYYEIGLSELSESTLNDKAIPVGTIEYVTKYLNITHGFLKQNPIEIPKYLRTDEFLKREYKIVQWDEIPRQGNYFIKNASKLKDFSYCGLLEHFIYDGIFEESTKNNDYSLKLSKDDLFVVSENFNPLSEYRVYVFGGSIIAISNYDGDPTILPDIDLIKKAVNTINNTEKWLKSYTVDIMVNKIGTAIIEIHNFTSCGIYTTLPGSELPYAYVDGIHYLLNDNKEIER